MIVAKTGLFSTKLFGLGVAAVFIGACSSTPDNDVTNTGGSGGEGQWSGGSGGVGVGGAGGGSAGNGGAFASAGCGMPAKDADESYVSIPVTSADKTVIRQFWISIPAGYDPNLSNKLIVGLHGRDYSGELMKDYLGLEAAPVIPETNEIFIYPDALLRDWGDWGSMIGWQLGPGAADTNAAGEDDVAFIDAMIAYMNDNYCIDPDRIFVTGQSWGGDFSNALACLRGDVFRASVPVAANGIYYLESPPVLCKSSAAVWAMHGKGDPYFAIMLGEEVRDFWRTQNGCSTSFEDLGITTAGGSPEECIEYSGCTEVVRYCAYDESFGHQVPDDYYARVTMDFFRSF